MVELFPNILNNPSTNNARVVNPKIILMTVASRLCFAIDASSIFTASATASFTASAMRVSTSSLVYVYLRIFSSVTVLS